MKGWIIYIGCCIASIGYGHAPEDFYAFKGKHFFGSYAGCDKEALGNVEQMLQVMDKAVLASGATILERSYYVFPENGLTVVYLLSESHASLHTYPEYGACFVDLFTCGDHCSSKEFDKILKDYLQPSLGNARFF
jgi:S-adenosylmethionine decarboxylase